MQQCISLPMICRVRAASFVTFPALRKFGWLPPCPGKGRTGARGAGRRLRSMS